jgi:transposase
MTATLTHSSNSQPALYLAFELGCGDWKLAFATAPADAPRLRSIGARKLEALQQEIAKAKKRFGLAEDAVVYCCYEAGRDGFWLHRWLQAQGFHNLIVDSASIEVNRRKRRAKNDQLDAAKLVTMLLRYHGGEKKLWRVVRVPSPEDEDRRQLHRDLLELKAEQTQHVNRIKGLLAGCGLVMAKIGDDFATTVAELRQWDGSPVPAELQQRLLREYERHEYVHRQIRDVENERLRRLRKSPEKPLEQVRKLLNLRGIGVNSAWLYVMEFFGWRQIKNRRELASLAGLTPTPYDSGDSKREQGISKAGNRRLRMMTVEIAWCWLQFQPQSGLSEWYQQRWGKGNSRQRRIGIVALARKLLVALWRYLETGVAPVGAVIGDWKDKMRVPKTKVESLA